MAPFDEIEQELGGPVQEIATPATIIGGIHNVIGDAVRSLDADDVAALMGTATSDGSVKAAIVVKSESGWHVVGWFERSDGQNVGGVGILKTWKRQ